MFDLIVHNCWIFLEDSSDSYPSISLEEFLEEDFAKEGGREEGRQIELKVDSRANLDPPQTLNACSLYITVERSGIKVEDPWRLQLYKSTGGSRTMWIQFRGSRLRFHVETWKTKRGESACVFHASLRL